MPRKFRYNLGCGPSSFNSLAWWYWKNRGITIDGKTYTEGNGGLPTYNHINHKPDNKTDDYFYTTALKPDSNGMADIALRMRTGSVQNGSYANNSSFTFPEMVVAGGNSWLQDRGADLRMYSINGYSSLYLGALGALAGGPAGGFVTTVVDLIGKSHMYVNIANLLVDRVGNKDESVIGIYNARDSWFSVAEAANFNYLHFSPIIDYKTTYWLFFPEVQIKTVDNPSEYTTLSDPWRPASGIMGAFQPSKEGVPGGVPFLQFR
jgi:hypothetical protein